MKLNYGYTEEQYEQTLIHLFREMGYAYECGYDVERDFREPYYAEDLRKGLRRMNPAMREDVLEEAFRMITHINEGTLEQQISATAAPASTTRMPSSFFAVSSSWRKKTPIKQLSTGMSSR